MAARTTHLALLVLALGASAPPTPARGEGEAGAGGKRAPASTPSPETGAPAPAGTEALLEAVLGGGEPAGLPELPGLSAPAPPELPTAIAEGFAAYRAEGPSAAIQRWFRGSAHEGSREALVHANTLAQIQDSLGPFVGYEVVGSRQVTERTRVYYVELQFARGPTYARFAAYRTPQGDVIPFFNFSSEPTKILPPELLY